MDNQLTMTHNHKEECKHEKLKYCKECDVVECECGREWEKKDISFVGGNWTPTYPTMPSDSSYVCPTCRQLVPGNSLHACDGTPNIMNYCSHKQYL